MENIIANAIRVFDTTPVVGIEKMREIVAAADGLLALHNALSALPKPEPKEEKKEVADG